MLASHLAALITMEIACPMLPPNLGINTLTEKNACAAHESADLSPFVQITLVYNNYCGAARYSARPSSPGECGDPSFLGRRRRAHLPAHVPSATTSCIRSHLVASPGGSLLQSQCELSPRARKIELTEPPQTLRLVSAPAMFAS